MARISLPDVKAWVENTKLDPQALDLDHLGQLEEEVLAQVGSVYNTSTWIDKANTPRLIQTICAKIYAGWLYDKFYSENQSAPNIYAKLLKQNAQTLINGILAGTIEIPGVTPETPQAATFYPNDASSGISPDADGVDRSRGLLVSVGDTSTGPAKFSMGSVF